MIAGMNLKLQAPALDPFAQHEAKSGAYDYIQGQNMQILQNRIVIRVLFSHNCSTSSLASKTVSVRLQVFLENQDSSINND